MKSDSIIALDAGGTHPRTAGGARGLAAVWSAAAVRLAGLVGLVCGLAAGWVVLPQVLYSRHEQPLAFSHALHADDAGMACADCHALRPDGSFGGIPLVAVCAECHEEPLGESPAERRLVDDYIAADREIPWLVYSRQPQNVSFSHAAHLELAAIACERCHGDHGATTTLPVYEVNRISTYSRRIWGPRIAGGGPRESDSMKMSDCSDCHAQRGVRDHCLMCHR